MIFSVALGIPADDAYARYCSNSKHAPAGQYCGATQTKDCKPGCYCTGGGNFTWWIGDVEKGCKNRWAKVTKELNSKGVYLCPDSFPNSESGADSASDCYYTSDSKKLYYVKRTCPAGQYLPANTTTCTTCQENHWCSGGTWYPAKYSQGMQSCPTGKVSSAGSKAAAACLAKITLAATICSAGQYLPANATTCSTCQENYYCPGGVFEKQSSVQGLVGCPSGQTSSAGAKTKSQCKTPAAATYTCSAGQYLPANATTCSTCQENYYCPGGSFTKQSTAQGLVGCPSGRISSAGAQTKSQCKTPAAATYTCSAGQYLPANATTCSTCQENYYCPGGSFTKQSTAQGLVGCPSGRISSAGAQTKSQCKTPAAATYTCSAGQYLPANTIACTTCKERYYCPGGEFPKTSLDQGLRLCPTGTTSSAGAQSESDCKAIETKKSNELVTCSAGRYLPADSTACQTCTSGHYCLGGTFIVGTSDQGLSQCETGLVPNVDRTGCEARKIPCEAGQYLPMGSDTCATCLEQHYCAGGNFEVSYDMPQGIARMITSEYMAFGPGGQSTPILHQCWTMRDQEYLDCVMGRYAALDSYQGEYTVEPAVELAD